MTCKIRIIIFFIACICMVSISCAPKKIADIIPIGSKLTDSTLRSAQQIFPYGNYLILKGDLLNTTGKFQPYILIFDNDLRLKWSKAFSSQEIDSIRRDTIYYKQSDYIHWHGLDKAPFDSDFKLKTTNSSASAKGGRNRCDKMAHSLSFEAETGMLKIHFFKSDTPTEGVAVPKDKYLDSSFIEKFNHKDSLTISIEKLHFDVNEGVLIRKYLDNDNTYLIREEIIIPRDSIWENLFGSIKRKYNH